MKKNWGQTISNRSVAEKSSSLVETWQMMKREVIQTSSLPPNTHTHKHTFWPYIQCRDFSFIYILRTLNPISKVSLWTLESFFDCIYITISIEIRDKTFFNLWFESLIMKPAALVLCDVSLVLVKSLSLELRSVKSDCSFQVFYITFTWIRWFQVTLTWCRNASTRAECIGQNEGGGSWWAELGRLIRYWHCMNPDGFQHHS